MTRTTHEDPYGGLGRLVGQFIANRYRIDGVLGSGGMGVVLRGEHVALRREVAIKMLRPELAKNAELAARFEREALSLSRLEHPNCLSVSDFGKLDDGTMFMVLQLLEGWELTELLGAPLPVIQAVEIGIQMLRALEHIHRRGIVHRDLKPENLFLVRNDDGTATVKLVDFGIAKADVAAVDGVQTQVGTVFGTPAYMSPEQALGIDVDHRADLYAAGCVLYELLAGRAPFQNPDPLVLVHMRLTSSPPPLSTDVSVMVRDVVEKLMARSRDVRHQTASEALAGLENAAVVLRRFAGLEHGAPIEWTLPATRATPLMEQTPERRTASAKRYTSGLQAAVTEDELAVLRRRLDSVVFGTTPATRQLADEGVELVPPPRSGGPSRPK